MRTWTDAQLEFVRTLREGKHCESWKEVAEQFNRKFKQDTTSEAVSSAFKRWKNQDYCSKEESIVRRVKQTRTAQRTSSFNARALRQVLDAQEVEGEVLESIRDLVKGVNKFKPPKAPKKYPDRFPMVLELMLSDLHYGKLIQDSGIVHFNEKIARSRIKEVVSVVLKEIHITNKFYNVDKLIVALLGDMIESYEMHDLESAKGCEYGTAKQIQACINSLLFDVFIPLAETGIEIIVPAVTGNHDRSDRKKTFSNPGENNWTWIIYNILDAMLKGRGYKNVKFHIPAKPYCWLEVFGNTVLYEHFDNAGSLSRTALDGLMRKRGRQIGRMVDFFRGGHFHEYTMFGNGEIIVNGSLPGNDSFADVKGFTTEPCQVLNYYLKYPREAGKKNSFHKTFGIKLD